MELKPKYREKFNCPEGEKNKITKEIFCNAYHEFCKYIGDCKHKTGKCEQIR